MRTADGEPVVVWEKWMNVGTRDLILLVAITAPLLGCDEWLPSRAVAAEAARGALSSLCELQPISAKESCEKTLRIAKSAEESHFSTLRDSTKVDSALTSILPPPKTTIARAPLEAAKRVGAIPEAAANVLEAGASHMDALTYTTLKTLTSRETIDQIAGTVEESEPELRRLAEKLMGRDAIPGASDYFGPVREAGTELAKKAGLDEIAPKR